MANQNIERLMKKLLEKKPDLLEELFTRNIRMAYKIIGVDYLPTGDCRDLDERQFIEVGKRLLQTELLEELFMTSHSPIRYRDEAFCKLTIKEQQRQDSLTSYRLWLVRPFVGGNGHPDWGCQQNIALTEMWIERKENPDTDKEIFFKMTGYQPIAKAIEVVNCQHPYPFCRQTRIYQLKSQANEQ